MPASEVCITIEPKSHPKLCSYGSTVFSADLQIQENREFFLSGIESLPPKLGMVDGMKLM